MRWAALFLGLWAASALPVFSLSNTPWGHPSSVRLRFWSLFIVFFVLSTLLGVRVFTFAARMQSSPSMTYCSQSVFCFFFFFKSGFLDYLSLSSMSFLKCFDCLHFKIVGYIFSFRPFSDTFLSLNHVLLLRQTFSLLICGLVSLMMCCFGNLQ